MAELRSQLDLEGYHRSILVFLDTMVMSADLRSHTVIHQDQTLINVRLPLQDGLYQCVIHGGSVRSLEPMAAEMPTEVAETVLDLQGDWLSLGGIDLQINGGLGLAFPDLTADSSESLDQICQYLWQQGVDGFLPTLVTTSVDNIHRALAAIATYQQSQWAMQPQRATILGVHLEGPFLNPIKRGAHPEEFLQPLTLDAVKRVLGDYASLVKVMTLAPELDPSGGVIEALRSQDIIVSLGHSLASDEEARRAFDQGATMVTHAFNAMPPLHHREPGLLAAAILDERVTCGLIADGQHVAPTMMELFLRVSEYEKGVFLVSDALAPLGLADGVYPWDSRKIEVKQGTARLPCGTLAGTTLPLLVGAQNLVQWGLCSPEQAISLATTSPRQALLGLAAGQSSSFLRWHYQPAEQVLTWQRLAS